MHIIVTIKQVPETDKVKMDPETGTMVRSGLESIVNPLDLYAIEEALVLKERFGARITVLSMGPPDAERALREALSMGCDEAVLLTDRVFAGSDTWATSRVLAEAVKKIGAFDIILAGERATDGDTGQVGPALAAWLGIPVISYASGLELLTDSAIADSKAADEKRSGVPFAPSTVRARRLTEEGYQILETEMPCLITVVKEIASPRLPTLRGKKFARSAQVLRWGARELGLGTEDAGLLGSPTRVTKIFYPKVSRDGERLVARDEEGIARAVNRIFALLEEKGCLSSVHEAALATAHQERTSLYSKASATHENLELASLDQEAARNHSAAKLSPADPLSAELSASSPGAAKSATPKPEVWIIAERRHVGLDSVSFELLARARTLADALHTSLAAIVVAPSLADEEAQALIAYGADSVIALESLNFDDFVCETWADALFALARERKPDIVLAAATTTGRTLMPYLAAKLGTGLTADCTELAIEEGTGLLLQTRPAIGGNIMATIKTPKHKPQMATVRPHSAQPLSPDFERKGTVLRAQALQPAESRAGTQQIAVRTRVLSMERNTKGFENLEGARMVVSGGRGLKKAENFKLVRELADALGAVVGASREAVDRGWISYPHQVGLSGKTISPEIYLCAGISGAIQHLAGIRTAKTIISINSDPEAPIHAVADLAVVGDLFEILPRLAERVRSAKTGISTEGNHAL